MRSLLAPKVTVTGTGRREASPEVGVTRISLTLLVALPGDTTICQGMLEQTVNWTVPAAVLSIVKTAWEVVTMGSFML